MLTLKILKFLAAVFIWKIPITARWRIAELIMPNIFMLLALACLVLLDIN